MKSKAELPLHYHQPEKPEKPEKTRDGGSYQKPEETRRDFRLEPSETSGLPTP